MGERLELAELPRHQLHTVPAEVQQTQSGQVFDSWRHDCYLVVVQPQLCQGRAVGEGDLQSVQLVVAQVQSGQSLQLVEAGGRLVR